MQRKERIIDIKVLLRCFLERWRLLLLAAFAVALILAGKEGYQQYKIYKSAQAGQEETQKASTEETGTSKSAELKILSDSVEQKNAYLVNSILNKIDPNKEGQATADVIVRVENGSAAVQGNGAAGAAQTAEGEAAQAAAEETASEAAAPAQTAQSVREYSERLSIGLNILSYYQSTVLYRMDYTEVAAQLGVKPEQITELVTANDSNKSDSMFTIRVIYPTEEGAKAILDSILEQLQATVPQTQELYEAHTFKIANETSGVIADANMVKWANTRASEIISLINSRKTLDKNLSSGTSSASASVVKFSRKEAAIATVKQGAIGFAAGLFGCIVLLALYFIATGKVLSGRELNRQYDLRKIACVPGRKYGSLKGPDKWAASMDAGYYNHPQRSVCLQVADANLSALVRPDAQIAFVSDLPKDYVDKLTAEMNKSGNKESRIRYFSIPCLQQTAGSVEALRNCDACVLIAKAGQSTYKGTGDVLDTVNLLGREVVGSIVLM